MLILATWYFGAQFLTVSMGEDPHVWETYVFVNIVHSCLFGFTITFLTPILTGILTHRSDTNPDSSSEEEELVCLSFKDDKSVQLSGKQRYP